MEQKEIRQTHEGEGRAPQYWGLVVLIVVALMLLLVFVLSMPRPGLSVKCGQQNDIPSPPLIAGTQFRTLEDQVVITGPRQDVEALTAEFGLTPLRTCEVRYRGQGAPNAGTLPFSAVELRDLSMGLYQIGADQPLGQVLKQLNGASSGQNVFAHPNYLVGLLGQSSCGNPYEVVGSPYEVVGSPYEVVGSPYEVVGSPYEVVGSQEGETLEASLAAELFWNQWAFQQIGVGPFFTSTLGSTVPAPSGEGVRVGVFDASPFPEPFAVGDAQPGEFVQGSTTVPWYSRSLEKPPPDADAATGSTTVPPDAELEITTYFSPLPELTPTSLNDAPDLRSHGLFVAGLIHAIAPDSEIHLYRVLDQHGCGRVFEVSEAVLHFVGAVQAEAGSLDGAVINLSLGVHKPRTPLQDEVLSQTLNAAEPESVEAEKKKERILDDTELWDFVARDSIASLRTAVSLAIGQQIVIVAAAGNDSYLASEDGLVLSPHYPALYPLVIGVSASNALRQRSCFSNWGDVAAPGGDGGPGSVLTEGEQALPDELSELAEHDCVPLTSTCSGYCETALISLRYDEGQLATQQGQAEQAAGAAGSALQGYHYAYWQGTSFSAPLVSGVAAMLLDASAPGTSGGQTWPSPDQIFEAIRCGAPTPDGVINAPASLYRCLP